MATPTTARSHSSLKRAPSSSSSSQVRVVVRIRPFLPSEIASGLRVPPPPCVSLLHEHLRSEDVVTVHIKDQFSSRNECYKLDAFFGQDDDLRWIFEREVSPVVPGIFRGLNATVFAYGATGSGKTYTMQGTDEHPGLIPQAMSMILDRSKDTGCLVEISYYEIYLDRCYDLLEPKAKEISVLEDRDGNVQLKGLSLVPLHSMPHFVEAFTCGVQRRKVAHTGLNDVSSRSHGVLSIIISNGGARGKLNLIDLAGNEDNRRTCNEGIRLQESAKINQSLFALSNVIYALNNNEPRVPYRESKLTRILQDSLGGTCRALMVACLNPGSYLEAVHTVSLAARSRHIGNYVGPKQETPKVKVDMEAKLRAWLESKGKTKSIQRLNGPRSPFLVNMPSSASCSTSKKLNGNKPISEFNGTRLYNGSAPRKLFDSSAPILASKDEKPSQSEARGGLKSSLSEDGRVPNGGPLATTECLEPSVNDQMELPINESNAHNHLGPSFSGETSIQLVQKETACPTHSNFDIRSREALDAPPYSYKEDISNDTNSYDCLKHSEVLDLHKNSCSKDQSHDEHYMHTPVSKVGASPPIHDLQRSLRKVLSPVNSNMMQSNLSTLDKRGCIRSMDSKTPKTPCERNDDSGEFHVIGSPLDKLNAFGSNLKDSLAKEYLAFLNVASKEELLALKGIGQKRAEYIFELRKTTPQPFKSLADLEKIGLSTKQAHDLFRKATSGIFL